LVAVVAEVSVALRAGLAPTAVQAVLASSLAHRPYLALAAAAREAASALAPAALAATVAWVAFTAAAAAQAALSTAERLVSARMVRKVLSL
jgi:hypothetical protein